MAIKRVVNTEFWTDEKVVDRFSPEDKLFMLYLLTNPHTRQLGIYKLVKKQAAFELGYSTDTVSVLLDRFEHKYQIIKYSQTTSEVAIKNFLVHSIVKGGKPVEDCLLKDINEVKDKSLLSYIFNNIYNKDNLNETVKKIINNYKDNEIENDNDNDSIVDDSYNDSCVIELPSDEREIFDYWNTKNIITHREMTDTIKKEITKALKLYSKENLKLYIDRYAKVIDDKSYFFNYKWTLIELLSRKDGISSFTDEGSKWNNYQNRDNGKYYKETNRDENFNKFKEIAERRMRQ